MTKMSTLLYANVLSCLFFIEKHEEVNRFFDVLSSVKHHQPTNVLCNSEREIPVLFSQIKLRIFSTIIFTLG